MMECASGEEKWRILNPNPNLSLNPLPQKIFRNSISERAGAKTRRRRSRHPGEKARTVTIFTPRLPIHSI